MEVMIPLHQPDMDDFDFNSARSSPYPTAPSTPRGFGNYYTSAPTTPSRLSAFYQEFDDFNINEDVGNISYYYDDFAFHGIQEEMNSNEVVTAEDLFEGGMIKAVNNKPPIHPHPSRNNKNNRINDVVQRTDDKVSRKRTSRGRGRSSNMSSSSSKRETRSLSPPRVLSEHAWVEIEDEREPPHHNHEQSSSSAVAKPSSKSRRKWRFRDLFLFRSASEGRASEKDSLKKYSLFSISRRRSPISAQELMQNKEKRGAKPEKMKKKTYLPHKKASSFWNNGFHGHNHK